MSYNLQDIQIDEITFKNKSLEKDQNFKLLLISTNIHAIQWIKHPTNLDLAMFLSHSNRYNLLHNLELSDENIHFLIRNIRSLWSISEFPQIKVKHLIESFNHLDLPLNTLDILRIDQTNDANFLKKIIKDQENIILFSYIKKEYFDTIKNDLQDDLTIAFIKKCVKKKNQFDYYAGLAIDHMIGYNLLSKENIIKIYLYLKEIELKVDNKQMVLDLIKDIEKSPLFCVASVVEYHMK